MSPAAGFERLRLDQDGVTVVVTMTRPPVNAVDQQMYVELRQLFSTIDELAPGARVVILAGEGKNFCAGNDLDEFMTLNPTNSPDRMFEVRRAFWAIYDCPLPVIGAVQGAALGTGLAIAASCDFVVAAAGARLGVPEVSVGVMGGARHLSRLVPHPIQRWMYFTADPVPVERLESLGAIISVVEPESLLAEARRVAARISRHSPAALRTAKRSLNTIEAMDLKPGYEFEQSLTAELSGHPDSTEAVQAFLERRDPVYEDEAPS